ncbi:MAG TPA: GNAT family N-acetyltransferase [Myxococcota bacterium]|nr:GNAT family N-acetyltransferase [Myxococcota bacterium]
MSAACEARLEIVSPEVWQKVEPEWQALAEVSADVPLFVGGDWVATWLEVFGPALRPWLFTLRSGSTLLASCLLTPRTERRGPFPVRCVYLNTAGEAPGEGVCVEYNQLVCREGDEGQAARALAGALSELGVDEVVATGLVPRSLAPLREALRGWAEETLWSQDPLVDLAQLRRGGVDYRQAGLSRNTRAQVQRGLRAYAEIGEVRTEVADSAARAQELLCELIELHQSTWRARGHAGAFASERCRDFHRRFVARAFERGSVQLVRVAAGAETIGLLYSFVDRRRVFFYQSGLRYREGKHLRPGLVSHVCAIERCLVQGFDAYHFLAGDETAPRYKKSLATSERQLAWVHWQRPGWKTRAIRGLRALKRRLGGAL